MIVDDIDMVLEKVIIYQFMPVNKKLKKMLKIILEKKYYVRYTIIICAVMPTHIKALSRHPVRVIYHLHKNSYTVYVNILCCLRHMVKVNVNFPYITLMRICCLHSFTLSRASHI